MLCDVLHVLVLRGSFAVMVVAMTDTAVHVALMSVTQQGCAPPVVSYAQTILSHTVG
jgi:hypothetical protein